MGKWQNARSSVWKDKLKEKVKMKQGAYNALVNSGTLGENDRG